MKGPCRMIELIINPIAGNGYAKQIGKEIGQLLDQRGIAYTARLTSHPGHATELAREAAARGADTVVSVGGDGTLTETAAGLHGTGTALGVIPAGTGNDFVKTIDTPRDWRAALEFILSHPARPVDTGCANDRFFLNVCGTGFDVMVLDYAASAKKRVRGIWPYLYGVVRAIAAFKPIPMRIQIGSETVLDGKYMICSIGNGRYIGGGIPITPLADVTDGQFELLVVDAVPRWRIPFYLPSLMLGTLYKRKPAHRYLASHCVLSSPDMRMNLDGEIFPMPDTRFECRSGSLLLHW